MASKVAQERRMGAGEAAKNGSVATAPVERADKPRGLRKPPEDFMTTSGAVMQEIYTPADLEQRNIDVAADIGVPGAFPYVRGIHETMYRSKLWTMRLFAGFGSAEETNERFKYL